MSNTNTITVTVQMGVATDETVAAARALPDVLSAERSSEDSEILVIAVADADAAKKVSGALARMFPGQSVRWGSKTAPTDTA